jgi:hypothetical protein
VKTRVDPTPSRALPSDVRRQWQECAKSGHSPMDWRTSQFDPNRAFKIRLMNEREARESGLWLKGC